MMKVFFLLISFFSMRLWAAPCCGGGASALSLLGEEEKRQLSVSTAFMSVQADAYDASQAPLPRQDGDNELRQRTEVTWAELLSPRWQLNLILPISHRTRTRAERKASSTNIGDVQFGIAYEFLPEFTYSSWRPRGIVFARTTAPTGRPSWKAREAFGVDTHGLGFWSLAVGVYFTKIWRSWDAIAWGQLQQALPTQIEQPFRYRLTPHLGGSAGGSLGYSIGDWRMGLGLSTNTDGSIARDTGFSTEIPSAHTTTTTAIVSYLFEKRWSLSLLYSDQFLVGNSTNSALTRGVSALFRARWERD